MANLITGARMLCALLLLCFPAFSPAFYALYLLGGLTDMIDGTVARMTGTACEAGARLDTAADLLFAAVCLIRPPAGPAISRLSSALDRRHRGSQALLFALGLHGAQALSRRTFSFEQAYRHAALSASPDDLFLRPALQRQSCLPARLSFRARRRMAQGPGISARKKMKRPASAGRFIFCTFIAPPHGKACGYLSLTARAPPASSKQNAPAAARLPRPYILRSAARPARYAPPVRTPPSSSAHPST